MKQLTRLFIFLILVLLNPRSSFAETLTLTTYYPSPFGAYDQILLVARGSLNGNCQKGTLYVLDGSPAQIMFCGSGNWGTAGSGSMSSWTQSGTNLYPSTLSWNVGIGTSTPVSKVQIHDISNNQALRLTGAASGATSTDGIVLGVAGSADAQLWNYENGYLRFGTNNNEAVRITSNGSVGIGTTNPTTKLFVRDPVSLVIATLDSASSDNQVMLRLSGGGIRKWDLVGYDQLTNQSRFSIRNATGNDTLIVTQTERVGIGTTNPSTTLDVEGTVRIRGGSPGVGKVLTSAADGTASWQLPTYSP